MNSRNVWIKLKNEQTDDDETTQIPEKKKHLIDRNRWEITWENIYIYIYIYEKQKEERENEKANGGGINEKCDWYINNNNNS